MEAMRFGILGCGSIAAGSYAPSLLRSPHGELAAVCRRDLEAAQRFAARFGGCAAYGSAAELLEEADVDAVIVSTPTDTHCEFTELAASRGKHVLCEKPMARNAAECRRMIDACRTAGVGLAVAGSVTGGSVSTATSVRLGAGVRPPRSAPVAVLTGELGAPILAPLVESTGRTDVRVLPVQNRFFGGNVGVTGLMVGEDVARVLADQPTGHRYLLPDVCLSNGRFLDGMQPEDLPRAVEVVATDGASLREALSIVGAGR